MGDVGKFLFMPVGLGGMGVDFTKSRPLEFWQGPKDKAAPVYDADAEKRKAAARMSSDNSSMIITSQKRYAADLYIMPAFSF